MTYNNLPAGAAASTTLPSAARSYADPASFPAPIVRRQTQNELFGTGLVTEVGTPYVSAVRFIVAVGVLSALALTGCSHSDASTSAPPTSGTVAPPTSGTVAPPTSGTVAPPTSSAPATPTNPADTTFVYKANEACQPMATQDGISPFPYPSFDPLSPIPSELPTIGRYYDSLDVDHDLIRVLKGLGEPTNGVASWNAVLTLATQYYALVSQQIAHAEATDATGFATNAKQLLSVGAKLDAAVAAVGFQSDSPCAQLL